MAYEVSTLLLLGASGDLAGRLLLPAVGQLLDAEEGRRKIVLVGVGSESLDSAAWRDRVAASFASADVSPATRDAVLASTRYQQADVTDPGDLRAVLDSCAGPPAIYFALPPEVTAKACEVLRDVPLPAGTRLVLEKPFGADLNGARSLNELLTELVPEQRIHRIDHFLGKSTVFNLLGLRFANRLFEPVWNAEHVERVDIVFDEQLTLENRARYYDTAGALRDMIQSHLLQVLALIAMDPPAAADAVDLRDAKAQVLRACHVWQGDPAAASRRARYTSGTIGGRQVPDYADEPGVDAARQTETLAEVLVGIDNWRWAGVPFRLRSGKALGDRRKEAVIRFKPAPHVPTGLRGLTEPDQLRILMAPDRITLEMNTNGPGHPMELDRTALTAELGVGRLPAYGEVLAGVLDGDPLLAVRGDTAEQCWRVVTPFLQSWDDGAVPLETYEAGSSGPLSWPDA